MSQTGYSIMGLHVCEVIEAANAFKMSTSLPLVHLHGSYFISCVYWATRWSQGRANSPMLAAMTVKTTWSDPY